jgi:dihydrofolate synthase/folylpolyglutamate synthase
MRFDQALSYLLSLGHETLAMKLGLSNTETLLRALGNPQHSFPAVQIAGTNGKGSTAVMIDSVCRAAGIRTGLFTSPHLISITERIQLSGQAIRESEFARLTDLVRATAQGLVDHGELLVLPTFFEHVTAIALMAFREAAIDLAILETGLGGRLDSTTVARANTVAMTPIAMDHEEYLGHSLAEIAGEKAAIIRPGVSAVIAPQFPAAMKVIKVQCQAGGVEPVLIAVSGDASANEPNAALVEIVGVEDGCCRFNLRTRVDRYQNLVLGLHGRHQVMNAAVAIAVVESLREQGLKIDREAITQGIETAKHPGRLELTATSPRILFDGAHNPAAARVLREYLDELGARPITLVFGAMRDKALSEMAAHLFPIADQLVLTEFDNPRAADLSMLRGLAPPSLSRGQVHTARSSATALALAGKLTPPAGLICVTGSLYLIGEIKKGMSP